MSYMTACGEIDDSRVIGVTEETNEYIELKNGVRLYRQTWNGEFYDGSVDSEGAGQYCPVSVPEDPGQANLPAEDVDQWKIIGYAER